MLSRAWRYLLAQRCCQRLLLAPPPPPPPILPEAPSPPPPPPLIVLACLSVVAGLACLSYLIVSKLPTPLRQAVLDPLDEPPIEWSCSFSVPTALLAGMVVPTLMWLLAFRASGPAGEEGRNEDPQDANAGAPAPEVQGHEGRCTAQAPSASEPIPSFGGAQGGPSAANPEDLIEAIVPLPALSKDMGSDDERMTTPTPVGGPAYQKDSTTPESPSDTSAVGQRAPALLPLLGGSRQLGHLPSRPPLPAVAGTPSAAHHTAKPACCALRSDQRSCAS